MGEADQPGQHTEPIQEEVLGVQPDRPPPGARTRLPPIEWRLSDRSLNRPLIESIIAQAADAEHTVSLQRLQQISSPLGAALRSFIWRESGPGGSLPNGLASLIEQLDLPYQVKKQSKVRWVRSDGQLNAAHIERILAERARPDGTISLEDLKKRSPGDTDSQNLRRFIHTNTGPGRRFPDSIRSLLAELQSPLRGVYTPHHLKGEALSGGEHGVLLTGGESWLRSDGTLNEPAVRTAFANLADGQGVIQLRAFRTAAWNLYHWVYRRTGEGQQFPRGLESLLEQLGLPYRIQAERASRIAPGESVKLPLRHQSWLATDGSFDHEKIRAELVRVAQGRTSITSAELRAHSPGLHSFIYRQSGPDKFFPKSFASVPAAVGLNLTIESRYAPQQPVAAVSHEPSQVIASPGSSGGEIVAQSTLVPVSPERQGRSNRAGEQIDFAEIDITYQAQHFTTQVDDQPLTGPERRSRAPVEPSTLETQIGELATGMTLTGAEQLRLLIGRTKDRWRSPETAALYAEYVGELPSYVVHRARIALLVEHMFARHRNVPE
jgi:hypothetical protein